MKSYVLLDRSASMGGNKWEEALGSINAYVTGLAESEGAYDVTVATFDTTTQVPNLTSNILPQTTVRGAQTTAATPYPVQVSTFDIIRRSVNVQEWKKLSNTEVSPRGGTPLYDATAKLVNLVKQDNPDRAVLVIMTDGEENSSREVNNAIAKSMLDECRTKGWQVIFLGADFNNDVQSRGLGGAYANTISSTASNLRSTMTKSAAYASNYAATGANMTFTAQDKAEAVGNDIFAKVASNILSSTDTTKTTRTKSKDKVV